MVWVQRWSARLLGLLGAGALAASACSPGAPAAKAPGAAAASGSATQAPAAAAVPSAVASDPALASLVAQAQKEGATLRSWGIFSPSELPAVQASMDQMYGIHFTVTDSGLPSNENQVAARIIKEFKAGQTPSVTVFNGTQSTQPLLQEAGALVTVDYGKIMPWVPKQAIWRNVAVAYATRIGGVLYNTNLVPKDKIPSSMYDLLDPFWKGKLAGTPYAAVWDRATLDVGRQPIEDLLHKLVSGGYIVGLIGCGDEERVASGEFAAVALQCGDDGARMYQAKGAPVGFAYLKETSNVSDTYVSIVKNAPGQATAELFIRWLLSPQGQAYHRVHEGADLDLIPGNLTNKTVKDIEAKFGRKLTEVDLDTAIKDKAVFNDAKNAYVKILQGS